MHRPPLPQWLDSARPAAGALIIFVPIYLLAITYYGGSPETTDVGYAPEQPVPYSHALHVGQLGLDCRYCHANVERSAHAMIPPTQTCMICHARVLTDSIKLAPVRQSADKGVSIGWVRVHDLPDYAYFDHSAHVSRGVGCRSCHGRVDRMERVAQVERLSMGWCLECHRNPEPHLRPQELVTAMDCSSDDPGLGARLRREKHLEPSTDCSTCHR